MAKKAGLFLLLLFWAFSGLSQESQTGFCPECLEEDKTIQDVENLKGVVQKTTCEEVIKTPECRNVSKEDLRNCNKTNLMDVVIVSAGTASYALLATIGWGYAVVLTPMVILGAFSVKGNLDSLVADQLYTAREFERIYKNIPGPDREQKTAFYMACKHGELLYKAMYDDYACLNDRARSVRACGSAAGIVGFVTKGENRMDLGRRAREQDMLAFYKVRHEIMKKLNSVRDYIDSDQDQPSSEVRKIMRRLKDLGVLGLGIKSI